MSEADEERDEKTKRVRAAGWRLASAYGEWLRVEEGQMGGEVEVYHEFCAAQKEYAAATEERYTR